VTHENTPAPAPQETAIPARLLSARTRDHVRTAARARRGFHAHAKPQRGQVATHMRVITLNERVDASSIFPHDPHACESIIRRYPRCARFVH
jgi:hypothetical protein